MADQKFIANIINALEKLDVWITHLRKRKKDVNMVPYQKNFREAIKKKQDPHYFYW